MAVQKGRQWWRRRRARVRRQRGPRLAVATRPNEASPRCQKPRDTPRSDQRLTHEEAGSNIRANVRGVPGRFVRGGLPDTANPGPECQLRAKSRHRIQSGPMSQTLRPDALDEPVWRKALGVLRAFAHGRPQEWGSSENPPNQDHLRRGSRPNLVVLMPAKMTLERGASCEIGTIRRASAANRPPDGVQVSPSTGVSSRQPQRCSLLRLAPAPCKKACCVRLASAGHRDPAGRHARSAWLCPGFNLSFWPTWSGFAGWPPAGCLPGDIVLQSPRSAPMSTATRCG